jgi:hypothetical protein
MRLNSNGPAPARRLTLETLESRWNPSTVILEGSTLIVIGTQEADTVAIVDDGQGNLEVTFDNTANGGGKDDPGGSRSGSRGGSHGSGSGSGSRGRNGSDCKDSNGDDDGDGGGTVTESFEGVEEVIFLGLKGDDVFTYESTAALSSDLDITLLLGDGNDEATITAADGLDADAELQVEIDGGRNDDTVAVEMGAVGDNAQFGFNARLGQGSDSLELFQTGDVGADARAEIEVAGNGGADELVVSVEGNVAETGELSLRLEGGGGSDVIDGLYLGELDGELRLRVDGGAGDDIAGGDVELTGESTGTVNARVLGRGGDDELTLNVNDLEGMGVIETALLNGGGGTDTASATPNVEIRNVP